MEVDNNSAYKDIQPAETILIPVIEEQVIIGKSIVEKGKVHIEKHITENTEMVNISLSHDEHTVEHIPMNVYVDDIPAVRHEGGTMIIPVLKEVYIKRTLLIEEIRITKHTIQTNEQHEVTLRKENVTVTRVQL